MTGARRIVSLTVVIGFAIVLPTASADTFILGSTALAANNGAPATLGQNIPVFQGDASGGYVVSSPVLGTITSWRFRSAGADTGKRFELAELQPADTTGTSWRVVAVSPPEAVTSAAGTDAVMGPFTLNPGIAIDVGYRIALIPLDDGNVPIEQGVNGQDGIRYFTMPVVAPGDLGSSRSIDPASSADNGQVVPVQAAITSATGNVPVDTSLPAISGTTRRFETLTADPGLWANGVSSFAYQWLRCTSAGDGCAPIAGASSNAYTLTRDDIGSTIRVRVTATNGSGASAPADSAPTAVVQEGVITARLSIDPRSTCTGVPTRIDGSASTSPDGIKSYEIQLVDLSVTVGGGANNEATATDGAAKNALEWLNGFDVGRQYASYFTPAIAVTFDWNRFDFDDLQQLARDPVGVELDVTDYAGHTASARGVVTVSQAHSGDSRSGCPKVDHRSTYIPASAVLASPVLRFTGKGGTTAVGATAACRARVTCTGAIAISASSLQLCKPCAAADAAGAKRPIRPKFILATGLFTIAAHHAGKIVAPLTKDGLRLVRLLRHGAARVRVTITTIGATGKTLTNSYSIVLER